MKLSAPTRDEGSGGGAAESSAPEGGGAAARELSVLYAEEAQAVAGAVKETLEAAGWRVEVFARGDAALRRLESGARFDVLILDFPLPGLDGVELARRARRLPNAAGAPIIMFTACEVEREARAAGVDAYLRKPRGVYSLVATAARLLTQKFTRE